VGEIISECLGDFIGIRSDGAADRWRPQWRLLSVPALDHCQRRLLISAFGRRDSLLNRPSPPELGDARVFAVRVVFRHPCSIGRKVSRFNRAALFFDLFPPGVRDSDADDLDRLGAGFHDFPFCSRKPSMNKAAEHLAVEPVGAHKQRLGRAMRAAGEQLQQLERAAGLRAETAFSRWPRHLASVDRKASVFNPLVQPTMRIIHSDPAPAPATRRLVPLSP
jgi:hypothetical protein